LNRKQLRLAMPPKKTKAAKKGGPDDDFAALMAKKGKRGKEPKEMGWNGEQAGLTAPDGPRPIPLSNKRCPSEDLSLEDRLKLPLCTNYGKVNCTSLRRRIKKIPELFCDEYNKKQNVLLQRPFHDQLGINKAIFIFCDNNMKQVYHLPMYQEWKEDFEQIWESIGIRPESVVRCLLARMPAKAVIPPHHDNGKWVGWTHRMHIPIITNKHLRFMSGPTFEDMERFAFNPDIALELNNAAKHAVYNDHGKEARVHLIFDWIEEDREELLNPVIQLTAGQLCKQQRGRIETVETEEELVETDEAAAARKERINAKYAGIVKLAKTLAGPEACKNFNENLRKFYIQHIDGAYFWQVTLDCLAPIKGSDEDAFPEDVGASDAERGGTLELLKEPLLDLMRLVDSEMERELAEAMAGGGGYVGIFSGALEA
jgi:hypothetical protein